MTLVRFVPFAFWSLIAVFLGSSSAEASCDSIPSAGVNYHSVNSTRPLVVDRPFAAPGDIVTLRLPACPSGSSGTPNPELTSLCGTTISLLAVTPQRQTPLLASHAICSCTDGSGSSACTFEMPSPLAWAGPTAILVSATGSPSAPISADGPCDTPVAAGCLFQLSDPSSSLCAAGEQSGTFTTFIALPPYNDFTNPSLPVSQVAVALDMRGNILAPMQWATQPRSNPLLLRGSIDVAAFADSPFTLGLLSDVFVGSYSTRGPRLPPFFDVSSRPSGGDAPQPLGLFGATDAVKSVLRLSQFRGVCTSGGGNQGPWCASQDDCSPGTFCKPASPAGIACDATLPHCGQAFDFSSRTADGVGLVRLATAPSGADTLRASALDQNTVQATMEVEVIAPLTRVDAARGGNVVDVALVSEFGDTPSASGSFNADDDTRDTVLALIQRSSGDFLRLGHRPGEGTPGPVPTPAIGRSVVEYVVDALSYPSIAVDEPGLIAFLESEPGEGRDENGNKRVSEPILRVYGVSPGGPPVDLLPSAIPADASPVLNGRPLIVSKGRVFFRKAIVRGSSYVTTRLTDGIARWGTGLPGLDESGTKFSFTDDADGARAQFSPVTYSGSINPISISPESVGNNEVGGGSISQASQLSADGRYLFFLSIRRLTEELGEEKRRLFRRDLATGHLEVVSDPSVTVAISFGISKDGLVACYDVQEGDTSADRSIYVRDYRDPLRSGKIESNATYCALSPDGEYVGYQKNLVAIATGQIYLRKRPSSEGSASPTTPILISEAANGTDLGNGKSVIGPRGISTDGRYVTFTSTSSNLTTSGGELIPYNRQVYIRDVRTNRTERVEPSPSRRGQVDSFNGPALWPSISEDGRWVFFESWATNIVPETPIFSRCPKGDMPELQSPPAAQDICCTGTTQDCGDVKTQCAASSPCPTANFYIFDRNTRMIEAASVDEVGKPAGEDVARGWFLSGPTSAPYFGQGGTMSRNGRYMIFQTGSEPVLPDGNGKQDVFLRQPEATAISDTTLAVLWKCGNTFCEHDLGPAEEAAVSEGRVAFLTPPGGNGARHLKVWPAQPNATAPDDTSVDLGEFRAVALSARRLAAITGKAGDPDGTLYIGRICDSCDSFVEGFGDSGHTAREVAFCGDNAVGFVGGAVGGSANGSDRPGVGVLVYSPQATAAPAFLSTLGSTLVYDEERPRLPTLACNANTVAFQLESGDMNDLCAFDISEPDNCLDSEGLESGACLVCSERPSKRCEDAACDPRQPFRVNGREVRFVTTDSTGKDAIAVFLPSKKRTARQEAAGTMSPAVYDIGNPSVGVCSGDGTTPCQNDEDCASGTCFQPPGQCIRRNSPLETCTVGDGDTVSNSCPTGDVCLAPGECWHVDAGLSCTKDGDCGSGDVRCAPSIPRSRPIFQVAGPGESSSLALSARGTTSPVTLASGDIDGDGVIDQLDNCLRFANPEQTDVDANGIGDACELCPPVPAAECLEMEKSRLSIRGAITGGYTVRWDGRTNKMTPLAWLGDPRPVSSLSAAASPTSYGVCIYSSTQTDLWSRTATRLPGGGLCLRNGRNVPCWAFRPSFRRQAGTTIYRGTTGTVVKVGANPGRKPSTKVSAKVKIDRDPGTQPTIQVRTSSGGCWTSPPPSP